MKAVLVIDMLNDFILPTGKLPVGESGLAIVPFIRSLLEEARREGDKIIYICDNHREDDGEFKMFPPHCVQGTAGSQIIAELAPGKGDLVVYKRRYSAFCGTDLDITLREMGIGELILTGVCTNICVLYTAADARNLGYKVTVWREGVASFDEQAHLFALKEMQNTLGATVK